jgi:hypothetical protein
MSNLTNHVTGHTYFSALHKQPLFQRERKVNASPGTPEQSDIKSTVLPSDSGRVNQQRRGPTMDEFLEFIHPPASLGASHMIEGWQNLPTSDEEKGGRPLAYDKDRLSSMVRRCELADCAIGPIVPAFDSATLHLQFLSGQGAVFTGSGHDRNIRIAVAGAGTG